jgi:hypothetical protein
MRILRFLGLWLVGISLTVLVACGMNPSANQSVSQSSPSAPSVQPMDHANMGHSKKININNAILSELDKLEAKLGVPALSNKIQASRPYGKPEELVSKKVITPEQFEQIKAMVTIEEVVLTGAAKDLDYMVKLGLMKGHMGVAKELLELGQPEQAEPHIGHPVEEIYADVEDQLNDRGVKEFKTPLLSLQDLVKAGAKDKAKVESDFTASVKAIDAAMAVLPNAQRQSPKFVMSVINGLLETANDEYDAAIADGKIKEAIEYQDSRGFVRYAGELYATVASQLTGQSPAVAQQVAADLKALAVAWPTAVPPTQPVKAPEQVAQLVKDIATASQAIQ